MLVVPVLFSALCVGLLLLAEWRGERVGIGLAKPCASAGFLWLGGLAYTRAPVTDAYAGGVIAALLLCFLGDVLLIPKRRPALFLAGLSSFLLAHIMYVVAFACRGIAMGAAALTALALAPALFFVLRWLRPHLPPPMRSPVQAYVAVISIMFICAAGTTATSGDARPLAGALLFYASDLAVARERFVQPSFANAAWGLPLYYAGQLVLAASLAR